MAKIKKVITPVVPPSTPQPEGGVAKKAKTSRSVVERIYDTSSGIFRYGAIATGALAGGVLAPAFFINPITGAALGGGGIALLSGEETLAKALFGLAVPAVIKDVAAYDVRKQLIDTGIKHSSGKGLLPEFGGSISDFGPAPMFGPGNKEPEFGPEREERQPHIRVDDPFWRETDDDIYTGPPSPIESVYMFEMERESKRRRSEGELSLPARKKLHQHEYGDIKPTIPSEAQALAMKISQSLLPAVGQGSAQIFELLHQRMR